jgi:hypothetical protein
MPMLKKRILISPMSSSGGEKRGPDPEAEIERMLCQILFKLCCLSKTHRRGIILINSNNSVSLP